MCPTQCSFDPVEEKGLGIYTYPIAEGDAIHSFHDETNPDPKHWLDCAFYEIYSNVFWALDVALAKRVIGGLREFLLHYNRHLTQNFAQNWLVAQDARNKFGAMDGVGHYMMYSELIDIVKDGKPVYLFKKGATTNWTFGLLLSATRETIRGSPLWHSKCSQGGDSGSVFFGQSLCPY